MKIDNKRNFDSKEVDYVKNYSTKRYLWLLITLPIVVIIAIILICTLTHYDSYIDIPYYEAMIGSSIVSLVLIVIIVYFAVLQKNRKYASKLRLVYPKKSKYNVVKELDGIAPLETANEVKTKTITLEDGTNKEVVINETVNEINTTDTPLYEERTIIRQEEVNVVDVTTYNEFAFFINDYYLQKGVKTNIGFELAASIATKRLIVLNHNENNNLLIDNLSNCFNTPNLVIDASEKESISEYLTLFEAINTAKSFKNAPVILIVKNLNKEKASSFLEPISEIIVNQNKVITLTLETNEINVPTNLYVLVEFDENTTINDLPTEFIKNSSTIHFDATLTEAHEELAKALTFDKFHILNALNRLKNSEFLDEEYWKKVDAIEEFFDKTNNISFDNKMLVSIEGYIAVMLNNLNNPESSLDECIANFILPICLRLSDPSTLKGDNDISILFNSLFSEDAMQLSRKVIKSYFDIMSKEG